MTVITLTVVVLSFTMVQPVGGQPGQWRAINPVFADLNDIWMISSSSGWAVGDGGAIVYWDGTKWSQVLSPVASNLESVSCYSATNCWAVGPGPKIIYWDGTGWTDKSASLPAGVGDLHSIWIRPDGLGYAVGASAGGFNIIRLNVNPPFTIAGEVNLGGPDTFRSIHLLSSGGPSYGFVVGDNGVSYSLDLIGAPGTWTTRPSGTVNHLLGVHMISGTSAFAVGVSDTRLTWSGGPNWSVDGGVVAAGEDWRGISLLSSSEGWIVATAQPGPISTLARRGATGYTLLTSGVPATVDLNSVHMLSASDGFAVGDGGVIIRWNGSTWTALTSPVATPNDLRGVWLSSTSDGWAIGDAGIIIRWNGAGWNFYQTSPVAIQLNEIHGISSSQIWAVGNDPDGAGPVPPAIIRWTGGPAWTDVSPAGVANNVNLEGVFTVSSNLAFAVGGLGGAAGTLLKWDGSVWASIAPGTADSLRSTWWLSSTDGWAVGGTLAAGTVVHCTGAGPTCATETVPAGTPPLNAVHALSSTNVWAVGNDGAILHRDGTGWSTVASGLGLGDHLNSLYMISATEGWAVGVNVLGSPFILYWDGLTWSWVFPIPWFLPSLEDVWMVSSQDGWSVGQNGLILRFGPVSVTSVTTISATVTATSTTTEQVTATSTVTTATVSTQGTSTQTVTSTTTVWETTTGTATITPVPAPIPGFPIESILAGLIAAAAGLFVLRRRKPT